jgi:thiol-disulfide isomerase/thioredoxin
MSHQIFTNSNREQLADALRSDAWVIACLCAGWCGSCRDYAADFAAWAERSPQHHFVWIDIEDQADLVGDLDIDDFPTLLIQHGNTVSFLGPMEPDTRLAERLLQAQICKTADELTCEANSTPERRDWQDGNLLVRLDNLPGAN